jgi:hypothetical protein
VPAGAALPGRGGAAGAGRGCGGRGGAAGGGAGLRGAGRGCGASSGVSCRALATHRSPSPDSGLACLFCSPLLGGRSPTPSRASRPVLTPAEAPWSAVECRAVECRAVKCRAVKCRAVECRAVECRAVECRAVECRAVEGSGGQCRTMLFGGESARSFALLTWDGQMRTHTEQSKQARRTTRAGATRPATRPPCQGHPSPRRARRARATRLAKRHNPCRGHGTRAAGHSAMGAGSAGLEVAETLPQQLPLGLGARQLDRAQV